MCCGYTPPKRRLCEYPDKEEPKVRGTWQATGSTVSVAGAGFVIAVAVAVAWVVPRLAWIIGALAGVAVVAVVFALVVVPRIGAWVDGRNAVVYEAARPVQAAAEPAKAIAPAVQEPVTGRPEPAAAIANHYGPEFHIYGDGREAAARLIRQALTPEPPEGR